MAKRGPKGPSKYTKSVLDALAEKLIEYAHKTIEQGKFPTKAGFAASQHIAREQLIEFVSPKSPYYHEKFSFAYKEFESLQEQNLVDGALSGKYNASFSIFTSKNVLGWRDEQHIKAEGVAPIFQLIVPQGLPQNRLGYQNAV